MEFFNYIFRISYFEDAEPSEWVFSSTKPNEVLCKSKRVVLFEKVLSPSEYHRMAKVEVNGGCGLIAKELADIFPKYKEKYPKSFYELTNDYTESNAWDYIPRRYERSVV